MCVWQQKADDARRRAGRLRSREGARRVRPRQRHRPGRPAERRRRRANGAREQAELTNAIQKFFIEESRLGIPVIFHEECLHGHAAPDGTSFPQPIGLAATFNLELVESLYTMTARRSARRAARIRRSRRSSTSRATRAGGASRKRSAKIRTSCRAWASRRCAAFRATRRSRTRRASSRRSSTSSRTASRSPGMNCAPVNVSMRVLRETFLPPFKEAIHEARRDQRDGVVQRSRRRSVARQSLAAARRAAQGMGLRRICRLRLLRDLGARAIAPIRTAISSRRQARGLRAGRPRRREHRVAGAGLLSASRRARSRRHARRKRELDDLVAPMLLLEVHAWACSTIRTSIRTKPSASSVATSIAHWRCRPRARRSRCSRTTATLLPLDLGRAQDDRRHRPERGSQPARRLQRRRRSTTSRVLEGIRERVGDHVKVALQRRLQDHARRFVERGRSRRRAIPPRIASRSPRRSKVAKKADVIVLAIGGNEQTSREAWNLQAHGRSHEPRSHRPPERARRRDGRHGKAGRRAAVQRPAALDRASHREGAGDSRVLVSRAGERALPSPRCCSASTIRAASCRSRFRDPSGTCRRSTTTSRRRGAAICSTTSRRCIAFGFGLSYTTLRAVERASGPTRRFRPAGRRRVLRGRDEHRRACRHRSGADVHPRSSSAP